MKNGTAPGRERELLDSWEGEAAGLTTVNTPLNPFLHTKGPREIKCGMMFASNNYHSISEKVGENLLSPLMDNWLKHGAPTKWNTQICIQFNREIILLE